MKKIIGIVGWNTGDNSFGVTKPYIDWLSNFGIVRILSPQNGIDDSIDLLVLPGGLDITPQSMNQVPGFFTSNTDVMKQYFYDVNLKQYIDNNTPIFGICLGFQQLCVYYGGQLNQNYPFNYSNKHRTEKVDELILNQDLNEFINVKELSNKKIKYEVNSLHHQGYFNIPNDNIKVLAYEKDFHNVEIAQFKDNIYGVQYHPEEIHDYISNEIILKLLNLSNNG